SAMDFLQDFVLDSHTLQQKQEIKKGKPFLFSPETATKPSLFEIVFIHEGHLFQYGFTLDSKRVYEEWLYATPSGQLKQKPQTWFERDVQDVKNSVIRKSLKASSSWRNETGDNQLFLSVAANRQSEDFKKPFDWIQNSLRVVT